MLHLALTFALAAAAAAPPPAYFRLDLSPSGTQVSIGEPSVKGGMIVFHAYPDGRLMSLRRSDVRSSTRITAKEAAAPMSPKTIANLPMQGGSAPVTSASARSGGPAASSGPALVRPIAQANAAAAASGPQ